jgi:2-oxoglutarate dehydrogenase E2 component (dihydrolipoamide succinyltransferase)
MEAGGRFLQSRIQNHMAVEIKVPSAGESVSRVLVGRWLKKEGDFVVADEKLLELETDKASAEVLAPTAGRIVKLHKKEGDSANIGDVLAVIDETAKGAPAPTPAPESKPSSSAKPNGNPSGHVMPSAERMMAQGNLPPGSVPGTGPGGRVLKEDVQRHQSGSATSIPAPSAAIGQNPIVGGPSIGSYLVTDRQEEVVEMTPIREAIAKRLVSAQQTAALVTTFNEIDMSAVMQLRKDLQETFQKKYQVKLGLMSFFVKAVVDGLRLYPQINAEVRGNRVAYRNYFDIGVAVGGGRGLVVPVLRNAERLGFAEIEKQIAELAAKARDNKLSMKELEGGTFTISNGGVFGSMLSTPIVNPPQSGILGLHAINERPIAKEGQVVIRPMMYVALTYDHRIVDGRESVSFLVRVKDCIENPTRMLVEV